MKKIHHFIMLLLFMTECSVLNAQEPSEKKPLFIYISYYRSNDELPRIKINTKTKTGRKFELAPDVVVNLFSEEENTDGFIGQAKTNLWGDAWLQVPEKYYSTTNPRPLSKFIATSSGNEIFKSASEELEIVDAKIKLNLQVEDSIKKATAILLANEDSTWVPVPETEIKFVIKRTLKDLLATEDDSYETDEEGKVTADIGDNFPGDAEGIIQIGAKLVDNDLYGNIETFQEIKWGYPVKKDRSFEKRTLWSTRNKTPWWLLIFPNLIIASVWGAIYYLIYLIIKIKNAGKVDTSI